MNTIKLTIYRNYFLSFHVYQPSVPFLVFLKVFIVYGFNFLCVQIYNTFLYSREEGCLGKGLNIGWHEGPCHNNPWFNVYECK